MGERICHECKESIKEGNYVAIGKKCFHDSHFKCQKCKTKLAGKKYFEKEDKFYCEDDFQNNFAPTCNFCYEPISGCYFFILLSIKKSKCFVE